MVKAFMAYQCCVLNYEMVKSRVMWRLVSSSQATQVLIIYYGSRIILRKDHYVDVVLQYKEVVMEMVRVMEVDWKVSSII